MKLNQIKQASIMDIFNRPGGGGPAAPVTTTPVTGVADPSNATLPNGNNAQGMQDANTPPNQRQSTENNPSGLDKFKELWQTVPTNAADQNANGNMFAIDRVKLGEAAQSLDFSKALNPELAAKALAGDANSLIELMNSAMRAAVVESTVVNTGTLDQALQRNNTTQDTNLSTKLRSHQIKEAIGSEPVLNHPTVAPIMNAVASQIMAKNPGASSTEVTAQAKEFMMSLVEAIRETDPANKQQKEVAAKENKTYDFSGFDSPIQ